MGLQSTHKPSQTSPEGQFSLCDEQRARSCSCRDFVGKSVFGVRRMWTQNFKVSLPVLRSSPNLAQRLQTVHLVSVPSGKLVGAPAEMLWSVWVRTKCHILLTQTLHNISAGAPTSLPLGTGTNCTVCRRCARFGLDRSTGSET